MRIAQNDNLSFQSSKRHISVFLLVALERLLAPELKSPSSHEEPSTELGKLQFLQTV
jgi:hypothetical protein